MLSAKDNILKSVSKVNLLELDVLETPINNIMLDTSICIQHHDSSISIADGVKCMAQAIPLQISNGKQHITTCGMWEYHYARFLVSILLSSVWPILFRLIIDSFTGISSSFGSSILCGVILVLNTQVFESMGRVIAELSGPSGVAVGVAFASILSQILVIAGGFYKTVKSPLFAWIDNINGIKYGFTSIVILEFSHKQSYWVGNTGPIPILGYTWSSIEFMESLIAMKERGVVIVDSLNPPTVTFPILCLLSLISGFRVLCYVLAMLHASEALSLTTWQCFNYANIKKTQKGYS